MSIHMEGVALEELLPTLKQPSWSVGPLYFIGDVGGTHARLGFGHKPYQRETTITDDSSNSNNRDSNSAATTAPAAVRIVFVRFSMSRKDTEQLFEFFASVLSAICADPGDRGQSILARVVAGTFSLPGPVTNNGALAGPFISLTGTVELARFPKELFPHGRSSLLNDLKAGGFGVLAISDAGAFEDYFTTLWDGAQGEGEGTTTTTTTTTGLGSGASLIVAPGTGLGTSLIYPVAGVPSHSAVESATTNLDVMALEFGSTTLPFRAGQEPYAMALSEFLHGRSPESGRVRLPIAQDGCCGGAIVFNYYHLLHEKDQEAAARSMMPQSLAEAPLSAGDIARLAKEQEDPVAMAALAMAYASLMTTVSEATMVFLPRTVVILGDNVVHNGFFFENPQRVAALRHTLYEHPMEELKFISRAGVLRQTRSVNLNLLGCYGYGTRIAKEATATAMAAAPPASTMPATL